MKATPVSVSGRIASRNVDVGTEVEKGTLLATLDPTDQQNQLRSAQGDLARIEAQLINAQANARRQQGCSIVAWARRPNWTSPPPT